MPYEERDRYICAFYPIPNRTTDRQGCNTVHPTIEEGIAHIKARKRPPGWTVERTDGDPFDCWEEEVYFFAIEGTNLAPLEGS